MENTTNIYSRGLQIYSFICTRDDRASIEGLLVAVPPSSIPSVFAPRYLLTLTYRLQRRLISVELGALAHPTMRHLGVPRMHTYKVMRICSL